MHSLVVLLLCLHLMLPLEVHAELGRSPLDIPLQEYWVFLGAAMIGGIISWVRKVRSGIYQPWSLGQLIGEMALASFAGLMTFWLLDGFVSKGVMGAICGMAGVASTKFLDLAEKAAQAHAERILGLTPNRRKDDRPRHDSSLGD